jgi:magnesium transporter
MPLDRSTPPVFENTAAPPAVPAASLPFSIAYADGRARVGLTPDEIRDVLASETQVWVDIEASNDAQWRLLSEVFRFHSLPIEDTRSENGRIKIEEYDRYLFIVVRELHFDTATPDPYDLNTCSLCLFLGDHFLVTVHNSDSQPIRETTERVRLDPTLLQRGVEYVAHAVLDGLVDCYFPLLDAIDDFTYELDEEVHTTRRSVMPRILELKRTLITLRRHLFPMREVMATIANRPTRYIHPELQLYYRDVYDHVVRQLEAVEMYRDLLMTTMEVQLAVASNATNEVVKRLTIVTTVVLPASLIAGIFGMNFERSWPAWNNPNGFAIAMGIMIGVSLLLLLYMARKKWI